MGSRKKINNRLKVKYRVRKKIKGTQDRPRLSVFKSNKQIYAQLINDDDGKTLLAASSLEKDFNTESSITKKEAAQKVGKNLAEKAKEAGIKKVIFDRNGYLYHGRVKKLAEGAREGGLNF